MDASKQGRGQLHIGYKNLMAGSFNLLIILPLFLHTKKLAEFQFLILKISKFSLYNALFKDLVDI